ncbi:MAG: DUF2336 domain-containing protein [Cucumibacter sp.]
MIGFQPYETFQILVESGGVSRAGTLLVAACDAFVRRPRPTGSELAQFEALAGRLFPAAASPARQSAAKLLAASAHFSLALERLAFENIGDGLDAFIASAGAMSPQVQLEIVETKRASHCALVAGRPDLAKNVLLKLFAINSRTVYRALAANRSLKFAGPFLGAIARAARMDHQVAATLAGREDFDQGLLAPAFFNLAEPGRLAVLRAFAARRVPEMPLKRTYQQLSVAASELCRALMKLYYANRRPEITRLFTQITGLDEVRCGEIVHDRGGAALFVVLRAFGCNAGDGLKVLVHSTAHEPRPSRTLADYARLFEQLSVDSMIFMMSIWRGDADLLTLTRPEYQPVGAASARTPAAAGERSAADRAIEIVQRIVAAG